MKNETIDRTSIYRREYPYKYYYSASLADEVNRTASPLRGLSKRIVNTYKSVSWNYKFAAEYREYNPKYLEEIMRSFMATLGPAYYHEYCDTVNGGRIIYNQPDGKGLQIFSSLLDNKSFVFAPKNRNIIVNTSVIVHEFGHVFERHLTSSSSTSAFNNKFNISVEFFSMFMEKIFLEYLKKINFNNHEIRQIEEDYYFSVLNNALSLRLVSNLNSDYEVDDESDVYFYDPDDLIETAIEFASRDGYEYDLDEINLQDIVLYTYGAMVAEVFTKYYLEDKSFLKQIETSLFDLKLLTSEEIIERMPHVAEELDSMNVLRKSLINTKRTIR